MHTLLPTSINAIVIVVRMFACMYDRRERRKAREGGREGGREKGRNWRRRSRTTNPQTTHLPSPPSPLFLSSSPFCSKSARPGGHWRINSAT